MMFAALIAGACLAGCSPSGSAAAGSPAATPTLSGALPSPAPAADKPAAVSASARLEPASKIVKLQVPVSRQQDRVLQWYAQEGQTVQRGQLLVRLDGAERSHQDVQVAQARVEQARQKLQQVLAGPKQGEIHRQNGEIARLQAELRRQQQLREDEMGRLRAEVDLQQRNLERYRRLYSEGACSALEVEQRQSSWTAAQRAFEQSRNEKSRSSDTILAQIHSAQGEMERIAEVRPTDVAAAQADVQAAEAEVRRAQVQLEECQVRAPQNGTLLKVHTRAGERISTQGLAELASLEKMVAVAEVYQNDVSRLRRYQKCRLTSPALAKELRGEIVRFGQMVQRQNVFSDQPGEQFDQRVVEVRVALDGPSSQLASDWTNLQLKAVFEER